MNEKAIRLYNAITDIDDELIEEASQPPKKETHTRIKNLVDSSSDYRITRFRTLRLCIG